MDLFLSSSYETCTGSSDGSASVVVSGGTPGYTYLWNTGDVTDIIYDLSIGIYTVTVTDLLGETASNSVEVELSPEGLWIMTSTTSDAGCGSNGIAHVGAMTGVPPYIYQWDDPASQTAEDAINLNPGTYHVTVTDSNGCTAIDSTTVTGADGTNIGDFVFRDLNRNGIQEPTEGGVSNIIVRLFSAGFDGNLFTSDDAQEDSDITDVYGLYLFECVDPGTYYIEFAANLEEYRFSPQYQGNDDELDSNADTLTRYSEAFTVTQGMDEDLSYDAGIYDACDDFTYGGTIGFNQIICYGDTAETLHTVIPPSGGSGNAEYLWLISTSTNSFPNPSWMEIPNSNVENYDPGQLFTTSHYIRCIRREGCNNFLIESENVVTITVLPADHEHCVDPFGLGVSADIMDEAEVMIKWSTAPENELYNYYVERSFDGINFGELAMIRGNANNSATNNYHFMDTSPRNGQNIYRIRRLELINEIAVYSDPVEVFFISGNQSFFVYPNPALNILKVETDQPSAEKTTLKVYNSMGQLLNITEMAPDETSSEINMEHFATGLYFIHIQHDKGTTETILKVLKK